jgi:pimeloyl-ACP methyl ester carboxylesterase
MSALRPFIAFACAHLTDERLYAAQVAALSGRFDTRVFVFRDHDSLGAMADELLANTPPRFTLIGLSLGGYVAFEIIRRQLPRIERLALLDTTAVADHDARKAGRLADIAKVREGGIDALIPELPARWLLPAHAKNPHLVALMGDMARRVGARGQTNQQTAMLARPDSHVDLAKVRVPTLVMCGEQDPVTPVADHRAMAACVPGARLELIPECGHLSTIEQPQFVNAVLAEWLGSTGSG